MSLKEVITEGLALKSKHKPGHQYCPRSDPAIRPFLFDLYLRDNRYAQRGNANPFQPYRKCKGKPDTNYLL